MKPASDIYRINPRDKVNLNKISTDDKSLFPAGKDEHEPLLHELTLELKEQQNLLFAEGKQKLLVVIQAMDAGGKDGCVKSVFKMVDPQGIHVSAFKKPTEDELAHDFLWRIHQQVPRSGMISVFNRSHYEDVIAVRVKKIFGEEVWKRRYRHIIDFERMLAEEGTKIVKIFLNISKGEQQRRLQARIDNPAKHWKFNLDDLKDRAKWGEFMDAYGDLIEQTSKEHAPWYVIPADRKWYRNLAVTQIMIDALKSLDMKYPDVTWDPSKIKI